MISYKASGFSLIKFEHIQYFYQFAWSLTLSRWPHFFLSAHNYYDLLFTAKSMLNLGPLTGRRQMHLSQR